MSDKYLEAAAKALEDWRMDKNRVWSMDADDYLAAGLKEVLEAWVGDRELYDKAVHDMNPRYSFAKAQELGWLVRVSVEGNEDEH